MALATNQQLFEYHIVGVLGHGMLLDCPVAGWKEQSRPIALSQTLLYHSRCFPLGMALIGSAGC